jgi:hypothetical protein
MNVRSLVVVMSAVLALAACAASDQGAAAGSTSSSTVQSTVQPSTESPGTAPPPTEPSSPEIGRFVDVTPGAVTVVPADAARDSRSGIGGFVANGLDHPIFVEDLHTGCTVAVLEMQGGNAWTAQPDCGSERLARVIQVPPGLSLAFTVDPASIEAEGRTLASGTYRFSVAWRSTEGPEGAVDQTSASAAFLLS